MSGTGCDIEQRIGKDLVTCGKPVTHAYKWGGKTHLCCEGCQSIVQAAAERLCRTVFIWRLEKPTDAAALAAWHRGE